MRCWRGCCWWWFLTRFLRGVYYEGEVPVTGAHFAQSKARECTPWPYIVIIHLTMHDLSCYPSLILSSCTYQLPYFKQEWSWGSAGHAQLLVQYGAHVLYTHGTRESNVMPLHQVSTQPRVAHALDDDDDNAAPSRVHLQKRRCR